MNGISYKMIFPYAIFKYNLFQRISLDFEMTKFLVCTTLKKSYIIIKAANSHELKFWVMIPLGVQMVLG